jgi:hypothetical protein
MIIAPTISAALDLAQWWNTEGKFSSGESLTSARGAGGAAKNPLTEQRVCLADIKEQNLGFDSAKPGGDFINVRAWVTHVKFSTSSRDAVAQRLHRLLISGCVHVVDPDRLPWYNACCKQVLDVCHGRAPADGKTRECAKKVTPAAGGGFTCPSCQHVNEYTPRYVHRSDTISRCNNASL